MTTATERVEAPASAAQHQLWLAEELRRRETGGLDATYSTAEVLAIDGGIDTAALEAAIRLLPERHAALRTAFAVRGGALYQIVHAEPPVVVERYELDPDGDHSAAFEDLLTASVRRPFPLAAPPLWRALVATAGHTTYLALVLHHIVADGWSVELLVRDLADLYRAATEGRAQPAAPERGYLGHAAAHAEKPASDGLRDSAAYWREALAGAPQTSLVPGFVTLGGEQEHPGGEQYFLPEPVDHDAVRAAAVRMGATPFSVYLSAFALMLARLAGQRDVVVGTPSANRDDEDYADVVGPFAVMLPVRAHLPERIAPSALVEQVATALFEALEHQELPLADMAAAAGHGPSRTGKPLFQTFALQRDWREPTTSFAGLPARRLWTSTGTAKYDLGVTFPSSASDPRILIEFDLRTYDRRRVSGAGRVLAEALAEVLGDGEITVLPELPEDSGKEPVHERVAQLARHRPDHPAVVQGRDWLSYADLDDRAAQTAAGLQRLGIGRGHLVGLRLPRGIDFITAALAVLKVGAAYVPADPRWPDERIRRVHARTTLTIGVHPESAADGPDRVTVPELLQLGSTEQAAAVDVLSDEACCVIYTSGSTGLPKGVLIAHRSVRRMAAPDQRHAMKPADRTAFHANVAFDATTLEVWGTLLSGGTVVVGAPNPGPADYAAVLDGCTAAFLPTGLFAELVEHPACRAAIRSLRFIMVGGGALGVGPASAIEHEARIQLNGYGPCETTTLVTSGSMAERTAWGTVPIGVPIAGARAYVLDERLNRVPDGTVGELHLAGSGVAVGYVGDPRLTAAKFLPDPAVPGARMYATGDLARRLPDGTLDFVGRADSQIKVNGFRVEPAEIEAALLRQSGVRAAHAGLNAAGRLVAAVRIEPGTGIDALRDRLRGELPDFMVPSRIAAVEAVPLTPNGKVDITALLSRLDGAAPAEAPTAVHDPVLDRVIALWSAVLQGPAAADTEFFEAGGDSLRILRLLAECRNEFEIDLRPFDVYDHSTPRAFTALLTDRMERPHGRD